MLLSEKFAVGARKCCCIISTKSLAKNNDSEAYDSILHIGNYLGRNRVKEGFQRQRCG